MMCTMQLLISLRVVIYHEVLLLRLLFYSRRGTILVDGRIIDLSAYERCLTTLIQNYLTLDWVY